jgi:hypothetical protein
MDDVQQHFLAIRHEIDSLKAALQTAVDDAERHRLHTRINDCIRESLQLVDRRLNRHITGTDSAAEVNASDRASRQRSIGD